MKKALAAVTATVTVTAAIPREYNAGNRFQSDSIDPVLFTPVNEQEIFGYIGLDKTEMIGFAQSFQKNLHL